MNFFLENIEKSRRDVAGNTKREYKAALGQFMTPMETAVFMASLLESKETNVRLLDPCGGLGALVCAAVDKWLSEGLEPKSVYATVFEIDERLIPHLALIQADLQGGGVNVDLHSQDYLGVARAQILKGRVSYTHAILNPPYKKIGPSSGAARMAKDCGVHAANLYSAFVGMALEQLELGGQLVAIIPRSFCNGVYHQAFREHILDRAAIKRIHSFESRYAPFKDDDVLQESVIILLEKGGLQGDIGLSSSKEDIFNDINIRNVSFEEVVLPEDPQKFVHIPLERELLRLANLNGRCKLEKLGVSVSTGPVVSFRTIEHQTDRRSSRSAPMIYSRNIVDQSVEWPTERHSKKRRLKINRLTGGLLFPMGVYVIVKRLSPKESKRRIVAALVQPTNFDGETHLAFDNGLNVLHARKSSLEPCLAAGLWAYLNSKCVDQYFRSFNGHTQVNAADLNSLPYPSLERLRVLGDAIINAKFDFLRIDDLVLDTLGL
ncbi:Eco57I restriction-modification methylase domain-containing protein [Xanthomonas sp. fls2-241-TYG-148]|uniref:Eco57I restriction-modification methylase domain-containing protein n=1 Tax=Xanthomonas sp. fls2-241-TYG-148 TaxID=3040328 RepID=UPI0025530CAC|nr:Eco57I restriction-modification methylase domain-containing protein [Xanthomonas sp. fls2-241-TYG-148]